MQNFNELRREAEEVKERLRNDILELRDVLKRIAGEGSENGQVLARESLKQAGKRIEDAVTEAEKRFERALNTLTGCNLTYDDFITRELDFKDFTNIEVDCAIQIEISQSDNYRVSLWASQSLQEYVNAVKSGHTLKLSLKSQNFNARPIVTVRITLPQINKLRLGGATTGTMRGFTSNELSIYLSASSKLEMNTVVRTMKCEISGASRLNGSVQVDDADLILSGASRLMLNGSVGRMTLGAWGASKAWLDELTLQDAEIHLKGASEATIKAMGTLDIDLSGGSRLTYYGNPIINAVSVAGASSLNHR